MLINSSCAAPFVASTKLVAVIYHNKAAALVKIAATPLQQLQ
jgi:hypothetical protein